MRNLLSLILFCAMIGVSITCGSSEDDYCHKLERCDLLDEYGTDIDECLDSFEQLEPKLQRECTNPSEVLKASDRLFACLSELSCEELEELEDQPDKCEKEAAEFLNAGIDNCPSGDDDEGDDDYDDATSDDDSTVDDDYSEGDDVASGSDDDGAGTGDSCCDYEDDVCELAFNGECNCENQEWDAEDCSS